MGPRRSIRFLELFGTPRRDRDVGDARPGSDAGGAATGPGAARAGGDGRVVSTRGRSTIDVSTLPPPGSAAASSPVVTADVGHDTSRATLSAAVIAALPATTTTRPRPRMLGEDSFRTACRPRVFAGWPRVGCCWIPGAATTSPCWWPILRAPSPPACTAASLSRSRRPATRLRLSDLVCGRRAAARWSSRRWPPTTSPTTLGPFRVVPRTPRPLHARRVAEAVLRGLRRAAHPTGISYQVEGRELDESWIQPGPAGANGPSSPPRPRAGSCRPPSANGLVGEYRAARSRWRTAAQRLVTVEPARIPARRTANEVEVVSDVAERSADNAP